MMSGKTEEMEYLQQQFSVRFEYTVFFSNRLFDPANPAFRNFLAGNKADTTKKLFFVVDGGVAKAHPALLDEIRGYLGEIPGFYLVPDILVIPGGEQCKNDNRYLDQIIEAVDIYGIDRHSYIIAIGGGAILDLAGFGAAVSHRGIRHIRIPTTVLSQNDSGMGVKNSINYKGKKNFIGSFVPPVAVFNDAAFLETLSMKDYRSGISEAVKVALIKDAAFFYWIAAHAASLAERNGKDMHYLIKQCAGLHLQHIASGDAFEMGSSRPLDFGHWSAHKVEQLSGFSIRHGEAVAMGIALDTAYSYLSGRLKKDDALKVTDTLRHIGFAITHPLMEIEDDNSPVLKGLNEFREHLGGKLTIMLLNDIGTGEEVHELDAELLKKAAAWLKTIA